MSLPQTDPVRRRKMGGQADGTASACNYCATSPASPTSPSPAAPT